MSGRFVTRRLGLLEMAAIVALAGLLAAPASARSASPKPVRLRISLPAPGHLTLESISATVRHPSARQRRLGLLKPSFPSARSLPPSVRILYLRRTFRTRGSVKTILLFLAINRARPKSAAQAMALGFTESGCPPGAPIVEMSNKSDPGLMTVGGVTYDSNGNIVNIDACSLLGSRKPAFAVSTAVAENVDLAKASQMRLAEQPLNDLFNGHVPSGSDFEQLLTESKSTSPALNIGRFDDGHAFAWNAPSQGDLVGLLYAVAHDRPQNLVSDFEVILHVDINGDGKSGSAPPKQQLYKFSFGPLGLTFDDTVPVQGGQPDVEHWSVQIQGGTACGTSLATAAFELPWTLTVNGGPPQQRTALESFATNPFRFYNFSDTSNNSSLAMNLRLVNGSSPSVQVEETHTGSGITNVSVNSQHAAVTATPVSPTC